MIKYIGEWGEHYGVVYMFFFLDARYFLFVTDAKYLKAYIFYFKL